VGKNFFPYMSCVIVSRSKALCCRTLAKPGSE
jgi:hypothetical protein